MSKQEELDIFLLEMRSDKYGDTGNYNTEILKSGIQKLLNSEVTAVLDELEKQKNTPIALASSDKFKGGVVTVEAINSIKQRYTSGEREG